MKTEGLDGHKKSGVEMVSNPLHIGGGGKAAGRHDFAQVEESFEFDAIKASKDIPEDSDSISSQISKKGWGKLDTSMITVGCIVFVGDTSRGVLFPVLSTLCTTLRGSVVDLGYLVAMFSIGRLVVTAPLGYLSDQYRHRLPLVISSFLLVLGAALWANAYLTNRISVLYAAQFLLGVGSGSLGVTRSFVVEQCEPKKRTEALALITALQYAGFTVSPIVGSWLVTIGATSGQYWAFALPAYLIALLAFWCLVALLAVFKDIPAAAVVYTHSTKDITTSQKIQEEEEDREEEQKEDRETTDSSSDSVSHLMYDTHATAAATAANAATTSSATSSAVKEEPDVENRLERSRTRSGSRQRSGSRARSQSPSILPRSDKRREDEEVKRIKDGMFFVIIGMFLLNISTKGSISVYETLGAQIGLIDYGMSHVALGGLISGSGAIGFCQLLLFSQIWTKNFTDIQLMLGGIAVMLVAQLIGLSYGTVPDFGRYVTSVVLMYAIGYPIGHTAVLGAFSKIQKSGPQAALMGWFATSGSFSRILLPIVSGYLDKSVDNSPFNIVLFLLALSYLGIVLLKANMLIYIDVDEESGKKILIDSDEAPFIGVRGRVMGYKKHWDGLSRWDKAQALVMLFLMVFSIVDLIKMSGGSRRQKGYNIDMDQGLDID